MDLAQEVRQPADVILVRMGEHDRPDLAVAEVAEVGEDQVDAEVLVAWKREPGVDHDRLAGDLEDGHVLPDLAEAAEGITRKTVAHGSKNGRSPNGDVEPRT